MIKFLIIIYFVVGTLVYTVWVKDNIKLGAEVYFIGVFIGILWPVGLIILPFWILYIIFTPLAYYIIKKKDEFKKWLTYKRFETFLIKKDVYSQIVDNIMTNKQKTLKEYVYSTPVEFLIQDLSYDNKIDYHNLNEEWEQLNLG